MRAVRAAAKRLGDGAPRKESGIMPDKTHLLVPAPPWRTGWPGVTGCGHRADQVAGPLLGPDEFMARRAARPPPAMCDVCARAAWRWQSVRWTWERNPVAVIAEDCGWPNRTGRRAQLAAELRAIAALVAAHPEEFAEALEGEQIMAWMTSEGSSGVRPRGRQ
jgi:hypothetical protein